MRHETRTCHSLPATRSMSIRRNMPASNEYVRWSTPHSHPLSFLQQEAWVLNQQTYTNVRTCLEMRLPLQHMHYAGYKMPLAFSLLHCTIQAIRGASSSQGHTVKSPTAIDLVNTGANITNDLQFSLLKLLFPFFLYTLSNMYRPPKR